MPAVLPVSLPDELSSEPPGALVPVELELVDDPEDVVSLELVAGVVLPLSPCTAVEGVLADVLELLQPPMASRTVPNSKTEMVDERRTTRYMICYPLASY